MVDLQVSVAGGGDDGTPPSAVDRDAPAQSSRKEASANTQQVTASELSFRDHFVGLERKSVKHTLMIGAGYVCS